MLRSAIVTGLVVAGFVRVHAADESIDMRRVRELRTRVVKGEQLSPEDEAYYERGKEAWTSQHTRKTDPRRRPNDPTAETRARPGDDFTVSEELCPIEEIEVTSDAGVKVIGVLRKPPGAGPFPVLVHLHGTLHSKDLKTLQTMSRQSTSSRFLAAGFLVVTPTFRDRDVDPQTRDALVDCLTMIDWVKRRADVDPKSVIVWGDSGGGSLALELAGETPLAAVIAQEPATILFIGTLDKADIAHYGPLMDEPKKYRTPELQAFTREKIRRINCPVFIAYGDKSAINRVNHEIVIPELKAAGKQLESKLYPGKGHGFSKSSSEFFDDALQFAQKYLQATPKPIDPTP